MPSKKVLGIYSPHSCGGGIHSLFGMEDRLVEILEAVDLRFWVSSPIGLAPDDVETFGDCEIDVLLYSGPIKGEESIRMVQRLRQKSKVVIAYGACAHLGGLRGLENLVQGARLRPFPISRNGDNSFVQPLPAVVEVDYICPGCPPPTEMVTRLFAEVVLSPDPPPTGTVFAAAKSVCATCPRTRLNKPLTKIRRFHLQGPEPEICLLDQGYICLGPVTRGGCGAVCPAVNRPCTGCAGPVGNVRDQGGAMLDALASLVRFDGGTNEKKEHEVMDSIQDILGTVYKYSAASSVMKRRIHDVS